ncbi:MAG: RNA polymerase factor sigma-54 [Planctomycetes bacterium]|nr:RNA polymerase factor sigma-54 [Planctomycetota bacterium]
MRLEFAQIHDLRQVQKLAPQLIHSIEILQLPVLELQDRVQQELEENPTLERIEEQDERAEAPEEGSAEAAKEEEPVAEATETPERSAEEFESTFEELESRQAEWDDYFNQFSVSRISGEKDKKLEAMQNTAAKPITLQDHLLDQFNLLEMPPRVRTVGENLIYNIDRNGRLQFSLEEIVQSIGSSVTAEDARDALELIQSLDPPGVGARTTEECLLLQLKTVEGDYEFLKELILHHLEDIKKNRLPQIARKTGRTLEEVKEAIEILSKLNPFPGAAFSTERAQFIIPDVIVEEIDGEYMLTLEESFIPHLRISNHYKSIVRDKSNDVEARKYIDKKIKAAKWLIDSIVQRQQTLYNVASELVNSQKAFLDHGLSHLRPLKMQDVADKLGIHVSTVSRAIAEKYMQTPRGIFPMKFFFSGAVKTQDGDESRVRVKQRVQEVIESEDRANPLSDDEIADKMKAQGIDIARRTVTKYRKALGIASSRQRREY